jgi:ATP/maltotriose-dependent transcriptional regulator MalT
MQNNATEAHKPLEEALTFSLEAGNLLGVVTVVVYQARLAYYMGRMDQAASLCGQWKTRFAQMAGTAAEIPATRGLDIMLGFILLERSQLEEAERLFARALQTLGWASWIELHGFLLLARLYHLQSNEVGVQETLQRMSKLGPQHAACAEAYQVWYALRRSPGDPKVRARAENWTETHVPNTSVRFALGIGPYHCDTEYYTNLAWARVQIALGHFQDASIFIGPALKAAKGQGLLFRTIELSIAQALAHDGQGNSSAALEELEKALEIGERYGYAQIFDDSPQLERLLQQAAERKIHAEYTRQLLTSFHSLRAKSEIPGTVTKMEERHPSLVDPLSERELEVLRLLASGLPTSEVAKKLFLSPFTLKAHTQNIYTKLGVHSRIEAINKARELDLL